MHARFDPPVEQDVERRVTQPVPHVVVPPAAQLADEIIGVDAVLVRDVLRRPVFDDCLQQSVFVAEVVVERWRLHTGALTDGPGRHVAAVGLVEQFCGRPQQAVPGVVTALWHTAILPLHIVV